MMVIQEVQRFPNHIDTSAIAESMNGRIDKGWRVHCCLVRGAEVIVVYERNEEVHDSITCLEKAYDELKAALKNKDNELKAARHYYNECLKDLEKAHAEVERLQAYKTLYEDLNAENLETISCIKNAIAQARAEAIKEFAERLKKHYDEYDGYDEIYVRHIRDNIDFTLDDMVGDKK
jgi:alanyl-tRNA synthetase